MHFLPGLYVLYNRTVWFTFNCPSAMHGQSPCSTISPLLCGLHSWRRDLHKMISSCKWQRAAAPAPCYNICTNPLNWASSYLSNWIYLFLATVSGISGQQDACAAVLSLQPSSLYLVLRLLWKPEQTRAGMGIGSAAAQAGARAEARGWRRLPGDALVICAGQVRQPALWGQVTQGWDTQPN